jgi:hypothetical protein
MLPQVRELTIDYTDCKNQNDKRCSEVIQNDTLCTCTIPFELEQGFKVGRYVGVFMYFKDPYIQNSC